MIECVRYLEPFTRTGTELPSWLPSPRAPLVLLPQQYAPLVVTPQEWTPNETPELTLVKVRPPATATGAETSMRVALPSRPSLPAPQQKAPRLRPIAHVFSLPAATLE